MTYTPDCTELLILKACLSDDDSISVESWIEWVCVWRTSSTGSWRDAPYEQLHLTVPAYLRVSEAGFTPEDSAILSGSVRATWANTTRQLGLALPFLDRLSSEVQFTLLKGAALVAQGSKMESRRLSDVDILINPRDIPLVLQRLAEWEFAPLYGETYESIVNRLLTRRDGWNFAHPTGAQLDLHWRLFSVAGQRSVADVKLWENMVVGQIFDKTYSIPPPSLNAAFAIYHSVNRGNARDRLQTYVDLAGQLKQTSVQETLDWARLGGIELEAGLCIRFLRNAIGLGSLDEIDKWTPHYLNPPAEPWKIQEMGRISQLKTNRRSRVPAASQETSLLKKPKLYSLWESLGRPSLVERFYLRFAPISKVQFVAPAREEYIIEDSDHLAQILGPGWSWREPDQNYIWTDRADARMYIPIERRNYLRKGKIRLSMGGPWKNSVNQAGDFSANPRGQIFVNGKLSVRYNLWTDELHGFLDIPLTLKRNQQWIELSIRPLSSPNPTELSPIYEGWKRSIPLAKVSVIFE